jgi:hypothetical protein
MINMADKSPRMNGRLGPPLLVGLALFVFTLDFVILLVTYLVLGSIAPGLLGEVAVSPARFAAWLALVKLPIALAHMLAVSWRGWMAMATGNEPPDLPVRTGRRRTLARVGGWAAEAAGSVTAALIVFGYVADPGDARLWQLVAVTVIGPFLLPKSVTGLVWLLRRPWRRKHEPLMSDPRSPTGHSDSA